MAEENFEGMPLTAAVRAFLDAEGWDDEVNVNEARTTSSVATGIVIADQNHKVFIETFESDERILVFFYSPYNVPRHRLDVVTRILNRVNCKLSLGRLASEDGAEEARPIQFRAGLDIVGSTLSVEQVNSLIALGVMTFRSHGTLLAMAALSNRSVDEIWLDFILEREAEGRCDTAKAPMLLN